MVLMGVLNHRVTIFLIRGEQESVGLAGGAGGGEAVRSGALPLEPRDRVMQKHLDV